MEDRMEKTAPKLTCIFECPSVTQRVSMEISSYSFGRSPVGRTWVRKEAALTKPGCSLLNGREDELESISGLGI